MKISNSNIVKPVLGNRIENNKNFQASPVKNKHSGQPDSLNIPLYTANFINHNGLVDLDFDIKPLIDAASKHAYSDTLQQDNQSELSCGDCFQSDLTQDQGSKLANLLSNPYFIKILSSLDVSPDDTLSDFFALSPKQVKQVEFLLENEQVQLLIDKRNMDNYDLLKFAKFDEAQLNKLNDLLHEPSISKMIANSSINAFSLGFLASLDNKFSNQLDTILNDSFIQQIIDDKLLNGNDLHIFAKFNPIKFQFFQNAFHNASFQELVKQGVVNERMMHSIAMFNENNFVYSNIFLNNPCVQKLISDNNVNNYDLRIYLNFNVLKFQQLDNLLKNPLIQELINDGLINAGNIRELMSVGIDNAELSKIKYLLTHGFSNLKLDMAIKLLRKNPELNIKELCSYARNIDFNDLEKIAPEVKNFTPTNKLYFASHHFRTLKTQFSPEDLMLESDMTQYLRDNYTDSDKMYELYSAYPLILRNVGELPNDWLRNVDNQELNAIKISVYSAIDKFLKSNDVKNLESDLTYIFNDKVTVKELGSGSFGTGYKISKNGSRALCLKTFIKEHYDVDFVLNPNSNNMHGRYIEPQNLLFVNSQSDEYVKFYFGRVGVLDKNDAFMVTQYLDADTEPDVDKNISKSSDYSISTLDFNFSNFVLINGSRICIDPGAICIKDNKTGEFITNF